MEENIVSIVMPAFNAEPYLRQAVQSVRHQTYIHWELVIVDDQSADNTHELAQSFAVEDPRIKVVSTSSNSGSGAARNLGIAHCHGRFLSFLDSDDLWLPERLEQQLTFAQDTGAPFTFSAYQKLHGDVPGAIIHVPDSVSWEQLLRGSCINCCTVLIDRDRIPEVKFPTDLEYQEDYGLWLSLLREGLIARGYSSPLVIYRLHQRNKSSNKMQAAIAQWTVYRDQEALPVWEAGWYFFQYAVRGLVKSLR